MPSKKMKFLDNNNIYKKNENSNKKKFKNDENEFLYPHLDDPNFNIKITNKKEFDETQFPEKTKKDFKNIKRISNKTCKNKEFELSTQQMFVRNFMSFQTPYNSLLIYHGLGTGKTCSSINVCEEMRSYLKQIGIKKKIIIVANINVLENYKLQLFDERKLELINGYWNIKACIGNKFIKEVNPMNMKGLTKESVVKQINKLIKQSYTFMGYTKFANHIDRIIRKVSISKDDDATSKEKKINAIKNEFSDRLIVIDEVHNIRTAENDLKRTSQNFIDLVRYAENTKLLLLTATPLYNNYDEIIWLLNLMNANDKRFEIKKNDIFKKNGDFVEGGKELLIQKSTGYISYVKGEDPFSFPYRIYPFDFNDTNSSKNDNFIYPSTQINGLKIDTPIEHLDLCILKLGDIQKHIYNKFIDYLKNTKRGKILKEGKKGIAYTILGPPIQLLNIAYPNKNLDSDNFSDYKQLYGITGLNTIMKSDKKTRRNFEYKETTLKNYGKIFDETQIGKYSKKIEYIIKSIKKSKGVVMIYSQYIEGGCIPMALALESIGITRYNGDNLLKNPPKSIMKYTMITGNKFYSKRNKEELKASTQKGNENGDLVKVVIISKAGSEGLDFKNIRQMHIIDPWYNLNRTGQTVGRAIRNQSHCDLPFEERNCQVFLYASYVDNVETADLYMYRYSENSAKNIGRVTRILKENAVDCLLNKSQNYNTQKKIEITLSNGDKMNYSLKQKDYSVMCDMMECEYNCNVKSSYKININDNTYNSNFLKMNMDRILVRIRSLFKEKYFYKKTELFKRIRAVRNYSSSQIMYSLDILINDKNEFIKDMLGRNGRLVNTGDYYLFQPVELDDKKITILQRTQPIPYKREKLSFNIPKKNKTQIIEDNSEINKIIDIYQKLISDNINYDLTNNKNWIENAIVVINNLKNRNNMDLNLLVKYCIFHSIDVLNYEQQVSLFQSIQSITIKDNIYQYINEYFNNYKLNDELIILPDHFGKKNNFHILEKIDGKWDKFKSVNTANKLLDKKYKYKELIKDCNLIVGFIFSFRNEEIVFKYKEMKLSTAKRPSKGKQCDRGPAKIELIKYINKITKNYYKKKKYVVKKNSVTSIFGEEPLSHEIKISPTELCIEFELLMRFLQEKNFENQKWFFDSIESILYNVPYLPIINGDLTQNLIK